MKGLVSLNYTEIIAIIIFIIFFSFLGYILNNYLNLITDIFLKRYIKKSMKEFTITLFKMLAAGTLNSINDIENIYKESHKSNTIDKHLLNRFLRFSLISLYNQNYFAEHERISFDKQDLVKWHSLLTEYILIIDQESPFNALPNPESTILTDLQSYIEKNDIESGKRKLIEISNAIATRDDAMAKLINTTKWSVPVSILGLILTLLFGILSIWQFVKA